MVPAIAPLLASESVGILLDGFPREVNLARWIHSALSSTKTHIEGNSAESLVCPPSSWSWRQGGRRWCREFSTGRCHALKKKVSENKRNIMIVLNRASKTRRPRDTTRSAVEERVDVYEKVTKTVVQEYSSLSVKVG